MLHWKCVNIVLIECANGSPTASNLLTFILVENIGF